MIKLNRGRSRKIGLPPGTLVYTGEKKEEGVRITVMDYDSSHLHERELQSIEEAFPFRDTSTVTWINIDGIHQKNIIESIGRHFGIHPLVMEDLMSTGQRPKIESYDGYVFVVTRMLSYSERIINNVQEPEIEDEQLSLIVGRSFVISFQEREGDVFGPIRERIRSNGGRVRKMGTDYLAYIFLDIIVDNYFLIAEKLSDRLELLEEELVANPKPDIMQHTNSLRRKIILLRKSIWPLREELNFLERSDISIFSDTTLIYLRDVHDHVIQLIDTVETLREITSDLLNLYLSSLSNRMNEVMKVLTIISTIFIPVTFIAGLYGMNFEFMPELKWRLGYPFALLIMLTAIISMIVYFLKKRWI